MTNSKIILTAALATTLTCGSLFSATAQTKPASTAKPAAKVPCKAPERFIISDITEHGFTAKWDAVEGAKGYAVFTRDVDGKHSKNGAPASTNSYTIKTLEAGTNYEVYVVTNGCATSTAASAPSLIEHVKTKGTAPAPKTEKPAAK